MKVYDIIRLKVNEIITLIELKLIELKLIE